MSLKMADRMARLGTETAFEVLARAKGLEEQGRDIIHMEIGEPDFDTPGHIKEAAIRALRDGKTGYCPAPGIPELRAAVAEDAGTRRGLNFESGQVVITPGAKPIMCYIIHALVNPGEEVVYPNPGFPIYESVINYVGAKAVPIPLKEEKDFRFDTDEFASLITPKTKLVILNYPQNPTGGHLGRQDLEEIAAALEGRDVYILADEIYMNMLYDEQFYSIARVPGMKERTVILDGFSKAYAMTGWRIGYGIMPLALAEQITRLVINSVSCTPHFAQYGALQAIKGPQDEVATMMAEFEKRRHIIVKGLNAMDGISCRTPKGAFYAFPNIRATGFTSRELEERLLQEAGVAVLSGTAFGRYGEGFLRLSYANSIENIEKALHRIDGFLSAF